MIIMGEGEREGMEGKEKGELGLKREGKGVKKAGRTEARRMQIYRSIFVNWLFCKWKRKHGENEPKSWVSGPWIGQQ
jgi:hypothetical protein